MHFKYNHLYPPVGMNNNRTLLFKPMALFTWQNYLKESVK